MADLRFPGSQGDLRACLARPAGDGPWPAVIVIHDVFGMGTDLRHQCDWLADAGYLALAPDLYSWGRTVTCLRATIADLRARRGRTFDDIEAARAWLAANPSCTGQVGVIGYCLGVDSRSCWPPGTASRRQV